MKTSGKILIEADLTPSQCISVLHFITGWFTSLGKWDTNHIAVVEYQKALKAAIELSKGFE